MSAARAFCALALGALLGTACAPSIDPAAKADIDKRVAALGAPRQQYTAPAGFQPLPFAAGQWTRHKLVDDKGQPSFMTYKVLAQEGDAFWLEVVTEAYSGRTIMKMLVAIPNRMDPSSIDLRAVSMKDKDGRVTNIDGPVLSMLRSSYQSTLSTLTISWQGLPQEDAAVPAGTFAGCFRARTDATWGPWHSANTSWSHAAVPLSGLVKSQGVDKPTSMELVDFGLTGATSEF
ncbi:MAG TPA: hypothetical protein VHK47_05040 [Polyangia bacterium]|jgi:hypothetical protein|nr:hypothetical protein [Polyangia bacterium]